MRSKHHLQAHAVLRRHTHWIGAVTFRRKIRAQHKVAAAVRILPLLLDRHWRGAPSRHDHTVTYAALVKGEKRKPRPENEEGQDPGGERLKNRIAQAGRLVISTTGANPWHSTRPRMHSRMAALKLASLCGSLPTRAALPRQGSGRDCRGRHRQRVSGFSASSRCPVKPSPPIRPDRIELLPSPFVCHALILPVGSPLPR